MYMVYLQAEPGLTKFDRLTSAGGNGLLMPCAPIGPLTRSVSPSIRTTETANNGSFIWPTGPALREVSFSSMFVEPYVNGQMHPWCHPEAPYLEPSQWASIMMTMAREGIIFRLFITHDHQGGGGGAESVHTNHMAVIRSYNDVEDEGDARYFSVTFTEFRDLTVRKVKKKVKSTGTRPGSGGGKRPTRPGQNPRPKSAPVQRNRAGNVPAGARKS